MAATGRMRRSRGRTLPSLTRVQSHSPKHEQGKTVGHVLGLPKQSDWKDEEIGLAIGLVTRVSTV